MSRKQRVPLVMDIEILPNLLQIGFFNPMSKQFKIVEAVGRKAVLKKEEIEWIRDQFKDVMIIGYNSRRYDMAIFCMALNRRTVIEMKNVSDWLINDGDAKSEKLEGVKWSEAYNKFNIPRDYKSMSHIDVLASVKGSGKSLKLMGAKSHLPSIIDNPVDWNKPVNTDEIKVLRNYLIQDLLLTWKVFGLVKDEIMLRIELGNEYKNPEFKTFDDSRLGEEIAQKKVGIGWPSKESEFNPTYWRKGTIMKYKAPDYIQFELPQFQQLVDIYTNADYIIDKNGKIVRPLEMDMLNSILETPKELTIRDTQKRQERINEVCVRVDKRKKGEWLNKKGNKIEVPTWKLQEMAKEKGYVAVGVEDRFQRMGIGGLHGTLSSVAIVPKEDEVLIDSDVTSYYPNMIVKDPIVPRHLKDTKFIDQFTKMIEDRVEQKKIMKSDTATEAERAKAKNLSNTYKICLNAIYGRFSSSASAFYDPLCTIQTCIGGQLKLLMLIEKLEMLDERVKVIDSNTDGICTLLPKKLLPKYYEIIEKWEKLTQLNMEYTEYLAIYIQDTNNSLKVVMDGKGGYYFSGKGAVLGDVGYSKQPVGEIVNTSIRELLENKTPIEKTIREKNDIRQFLLVGRGEKKSNVHWSSDAKRIDCGNISRWVYSTEGSPLINSDSGKSLDTKKCLPILKLDKEFNVPKSLDRNEYIEMTKEQLLKLGITEQEHIEIDWNRLNG